jgi:hypothetical protein
MIASWGRGLRRWWWLWLAVGVGLWGVMAWMTRPLPRPTPLPMVGPPMLHEEAWSLAYVPGQGQPGVPMVLDVLDGKPSLHAGFFARHGWRGLSASEGSDPVLTSAHLAADGFPALTLAWPSLHLPAADWCADAQTPPQEDCPILSMRLSSRPMTANHRALLHAQQALPNQDGTPANQRSVSLWTAFTTIAPPPGESGPGRWTGWVCHVPYLETQNERLHSWGLNEDRWAMDLADATCHQPTSPLTRWWPTAAYRWPRLGQHEVHPVLWVCPPASDCQASFEHHNRWVTLHVPMGFIDAQADELAHSPAHLHLRPRLVQAAWLMLEQSAQRVTIADNAPALHAQWLRALKQEWAWCQTLSARVAPAPAPAEGVTPQQRKAWQSSPWQRLVHTHTHGPCARSLHRVLRHWVPPTTPTTRNNPAPPSPLLNAAVTAEVLSVAQGLAALEQKHTGDLSEPLWHAVDLLLVQAHGPASIARLSWHNTPRRLQQAPKAVLDMLDALGDTPLPLTPAEAIRLRMNLAFALEQGIRDRAPDAVAPDRVMGLFLQASQLWLQHTQHPDLTPAQADALLSPMDSVALLTFTASQVRAFGTRPAQDGSNREPQAAELLDPLVRGMAHLAHRLAQRTDRSPQVQATQLGTLGVHAAWHAHHLALMPSATGTAAVPQAAGRVAHTTAPPVQAAWVAWLEQWTQWNTSALSDLPQGSALLAGVTLHRDAARKAQRAHPDCPGAHLWGCKMAIP